MSDANQLLTESLDAINKCKHSSEIEELRIILLGEKGKLTEAIKSLNQISPEERKILSTSLNSTKRKIVHALEARKAILDEKYIFSLLRHPEAWR